MDDPLPVHCGGDRWCPVTATASVVGKKWHPVIVYRLLEGGPMGFNDLESAVDGISSKVLSDCLDDLAAKRLVDRRVASETPFRVEYSLTATGESLRPVVEAMRDWGERRLVEAAEDASVA